MLAEVPYLIPVFAGFIAGCSAILLRQAERVLGDWLGWLSLAAAAASAGSFLAGFLWAASTSPVAAPSGAQILAGCLLALAGGVLVGWAVRARGLGVLRSWRADRFEQRLPYRAIRRPLELGLIVSTAGLCGSARRRRCGSAWRCGSPSGMGCSNWGSGNYASACRHAATISAGLRGICRA